MPRGGIFNCHFLCEFMLVLFQCCFSKDLLLPGPMEIALNQADQMLGSCMRREHRLRGEGGWRQAEPGALGTQRAHVHAKWLLLCLTLCDPMNCSLQKY